MKFKSREMRLVALWLFVLLSLSFQLVWSEAPLIGVSPRQYEGVSQKQYGQGVFFAPETIRLYAQPEENSPLVAQFQWPVTGDPQSVLDLSIQQKRSAEKVFVCYYPTADVALMALVSENGAGWAEVVYDQSSGKTAWVKLNVDTQFQTWLEFMRVNAKNHEFYWLSGVPQYHRLLRNRPMDSSSTVQVTALRDIRIKHVKGNWLLVEGLDFSHATPVGWIRWRDDTGRLMIFPEFSPKSPPQVDSP